MNARMMYWSTITKTIHCWRDRQKAVFSEWVQAFGVVEAENTRKMQPQPISGRWENIEGSEGEQRAGERATHRPCPS